MDITVIEISKLAELPKAACREYAGVSTSGAMDAFRKTGQEPGAVYQYGKRLFVFETVAVGISSPVPATLENRPENG